MSIKNFKLKILKYLIPIFFIFDMSLTNFTQAQNLVCKTQDDGTGKMVERCAAPPPSPAKETADNKQEPSVSKGAKDSNKANKTAQTVSMIMGGLLTAGGATMITIGSSSTPVGWPMIGIGTMMVGMGVMNFLQSAANKGSADKASGVHGLTSAGGGLDTAALDDLSSPEDQQMLQDILNGTHPTIKFDPINKTITANGKKFDIAALEKGDIKGFGVANGMSPSEIANLESQAEKALADAEKKAVDKVAALENGVEGGSGGNTSPAVASAQEEITAEEITKEFVFDERQPAGLSILKFNGTPVGSDTDDLFKLIKRRYESHLTKGDMIEEK